MENDESSVTEETMTEPEAVTQEVSASTPPEVQTDTPEEIIPVIAPQAPPPSPPEVEKVEVLEAEMLPLKTKEVETDMPEEVPA